MARIARIVLPRQPHLVSQGSSKAIFSTEQRRQSYLEVLAASAATYRVKLLAWSVLPRRVLLVIVPPSADAMGNFMRVAHARFTRRLRAAGFKGEATGGRFSSCPLDGPSALDAVKFVESAPVGEGLADSPMKYAFSSAAHHVSENGDLSADQAAILSSVGDWKAWHRQPLPTERAEYLAMRMRTGKPAGSAEFVRRLERRVGMNLSRGRGRPPGKKKR